MEEICKILDKTINEIKFINLDLESRKLEGWVDNLESILYELDFKIESIEVKYENK